MPQSIAKRGHYGAFLQDEWKLLKEIVSECHKTWSVPITAKIRIFPSVEKTVEYAKMLEEAGAQLLTVHGRTRDQKGPLTGLASWLHIKKVREAVKIPVFANGNIQYLSDVTQCMEETGVQGVMIAEGSLHNPALFDGVNPPVWEMVEEYLQLVSQYPCSLTYIRGHIFKMCIHSFDVYNDWRIRLGECKSLDAVKQVMREFIEMLKNDERKYQETPEAFNFNKLKFPYWICQPYVRPDPSTKTDKPSEAKRQRMVYDESLPEHLQGLSKKKLRKALQKPNKSLGNIHNPGRGKFEMCADCKTNARGQKCEKLLCKVCCRKMARQNSINCSGHNLYYKNSLPRQEREALLIKQATLGQQCDVIPP
ncbi:DUS1L [Bugula neritina]|uniref:DUS1L n=1 Tax=Bugula neritina TaxID=10212 RepID=A0A7J7JZR8_BUGNE|nr:DUS1L [Bugula neritina]